MIFKNKMSNLTSKNSKKAYKEILKIKNFSGPEGISNFGAISLTQIPGDPDSIKGHKARGVFWTKPDGSGKEVVRDEKIDKSLNILNLLMIIKTLTSKKFLMFYLLNIN